MTVVSWFQETTGGLLTLLCGLAVAILLFLIIKVKLEPFVALVLVGLALGLAAGLRSRNSSAPHQERAIPCWRPASAASWDTSR